MEQKAATSKDKLWIFKQSSIPEEYKRLGYVEEYRCLYQILTFKLISTNSVFANDSIFTCKFAHISSNLFLFFPVKYKELKDGSRLLHSVADTQVSFCVDIIYISYFLHIY